MSGNFWLDARQGKLHVTGWWIFCDHIDNLELFWRTHSSQEIVWSFPICFWAFRVGHEPSYSKVHFTSLVRWNTSEYSTLCPVNERFLSLAGENTSYMRPGSSLLCSFQVVLSQPSGMSFQAWADRYSAELKGKPLQISRLLALFSSLLLVLCPVNPSCLDLPRLLEVPSPQLRKTISQNFPQDLHNVLAAHCEESPVGLFPQLITKSSFALMAPAFTTEIQNTECKSYLLQSVLFFLLLLNT